MLCEMTMNTLPPSIAAECLTFLHGICYKDLPYFPLNQDPHRNLEEEIHDEMKDTCEKNICKVSKQSSSQAYNNNDDDDDDDDGDTNNNFIFVSKYFSMPGNWRHSDKAKYYTTC